MDSSETDLGATARLLLRSPHVEDLEGIVALWTDPQVTRHIGGPRDGAMVCDFFRGYAADPGGVSQQEGERWWSLVELTSGHFVGLCCLLEKEVQGQTEVEIGYFLLPDYWGRGYATEAATRVVEHAWGEPHLDSLVALVDPDNPSSAAVARKLGMVLEETVPRAEGVVKHLYRLRKAR